MLCCLNCWYSVDNYVHEILNGTIFWHGAPLLNDITGYLSQLYSLNNPSSKKTVLQVSVQLRPEKRWQCSSL